LGSPRETKNKFGAKTTNKNKQTITPPTNHNANVACQNYQPEMQTQCYVAAHKSSIQSSQSKRNKQENEQETKIEHLHNFVFTHYTLSEAFVEHKHTHTHHNMENKSAKNICAPHSRFSRGLRTVTHRHPAHRCAVS